MAQYRRSGPGYLAQQGRLNVDTADVAEFLKGFNEGAAKIEQERRGLHGRSANRPAWSASRWVRRLQPTNLRQRLYTELSAATTLHGRFHRRYHLDKGGANGYDEAAQEYTAYSAMEAIKEKATAEKYADNKAAGEKFLAENKAKEGVVTTPSGLQYKIITKGNGAVPADSSKVKVNYKGTLIDGTEFDSSYKRNEPATFRANQVIKGWTEALTMMPVGSKWELYIPYDLAYGSRETGSQIKPFSTLIFEVELLGIEK